MSDQKQNETTATNNNPFFKELENKLEASAAEVENSLSKVRKALFKTDLNNKIPETEDLMTILKSSYDALKRVSDALLPLQKDVLNSSIYMASMTNRMEVIIGKLAEKVFQIDIQLATVAEFLIKEGIATEEKLQNILDTVIKPKIDEQREEEQKQKREEKKEETKLWTPDTSIKV